MKKLLLLSPFAALLAAGCANDFEVAAPWKEIPVAYGIISPKDTAHYIRLEKGFLDPERSALEIAQIPDSIYYPENAVAVYLVRENGDRLQMHRVDGNLDGHVRDEGIFADQPNWLYKFKPADASQQLMPGESVGLLVTRADGKPDVTAETTLPNDFTIVRPMPGVPTKLGFGPNSATDFEWRTDASGLYFNIYLRIEYREQTPSGQFLDRKVIEWPVVRNVRRGDTPVGVAGFRGMVEISGNQFYQFLANNIEPASTSCGGCYRYFEGVDMILEGGGKEIEEYLEAASANSGITGAEVIPTYSNLSEGYGLFTGKNTSSLTGIRITSQTVDSMQTHPTVGVLNFRN